MATLNIQNYYDGSSFAHWSSAMQSIGKFLASIGWTQTSDTGQVVWAATYTLSAVSVSGTNATYSYTLASNSPPRVGISVAITGFVNAGNNVTATITAVNYSLGTFTVTNATAVNETHAGSAVVQSAQSTVPSNSSVYEIWTPGDGLTAFYVRLDYATNATPQPFLKVQTGTGTNGAGTLNGFTTTQQSTATTTNQTTIQYNCLMAGSTGWFGLMMWRDNASCNCFIGIERSHDNTGADTSTYVNQWITTTGTGWVQQHIMFGVGVTTAWNSGNGNTWSGMISGPGYLGFGNTSGVFNGSTPVCPVFPLVGYVDNPSLLLATAVQNDNTEGTVVTVTFYGASHSYVFSKNGRLASGNGSGMGICMRFE